MEAEVARLGESVRRGAQTTGELDRRTTHLEEQMRDLLAMGNHLAQMMTDLSLQLEATPREQQALQIEARELREGLTTLVQIVAKLADQRLAA
jgi:uncharacterized protein YceH (UPF0502 family)